MIESPRTCGEAGGRNSKGLPCGVYLNLSPSTGLCLMHDPERAESRAELKRQGGQAAGAARRQARAAMPDGVPRAPTNLEDSVKWSSWAMHAIATGEIDHKVGHEVGYLVARFTEAVSKRDLERQVKSLQARLRAFQQRRGSHE